MELTPEQVKEQIQKQVRAKKLAYGLLVYLAVITVAVIVLAIDNVNKRREVREVDQEMQACGLSTVFCPGEIGEVLERTELAKTNASYYDYDLEGIPWSLDHSTTASREFARGTLVEVTNVANGKSVVVLVNDYGPEEAVHPDRALDLSSHAFAQIAELKMGVVEVTYKDVGQGEYHPLAKR